MWNIDKLNKSKAAYFVSAIFFISLFLFFSYSRVFDDFEYSTLDLRYRLRPHQDVREDIVIIEIADDAIEKLGKWPFLRDYHSLLIKILKSSGAKTVIFDIFFSEQKKEDEGFAEAIKTAGNVYLPYVFELDNTSSDFTHTYATEYAAPLVKVLDGIAKGTGFINAKPDMDGKIRSIPSFIEYKGVFYPHLSVLAALNNLGYEFDEIKIIPGEKIIVDKDFTIPLNEDSSIQVNYPARWGKAFRHYSYVDVLQSYLTKSRAQENLIDLSEFKDAICFVGLTATAAPDVHPSPLEPLYPGVGVHTSVYNSIVEKNFLKRLCRSANLFILVIMWLLTGYIAQKVGKQFALLSIISVAAAYIFTSGLLFWIWGIWIDVFYPITTMAIVYVLFTFRKYVAESQSRELIEKELNIAKDIQESFLPKKISTVSGVDVCVKMQTAHQVGGDLYDIVRIDDKKMGIMIGDVSGKGVPAALYMAKVMSVFKSLTSEHNAAKILKNLNERLMGESNSGLFVTLTYMIFDTETNSITFAIGGHMPPILVDPDGRTELVDVEEGIPLGMIKSNFSSGSRSYKPGSIFIFYTDGVTEAMNSKRDMFGQDRLIELAGSLKGCAAEEVVDAVHLAVTSFEGKALQHDDVTVLAVRV